MTRPAGLYVRFGDRLDPATNARVRRLSALLLDDALDGVSDIYPGNINLYVEFDADEVSRPVVAQWIRGHLADAVSVETTEEAATITVPVRYDGEDLPDVAARTGLSEAEVVARHCGELYRVYSVGFVPGQPMLGPCDAVGGRHALHLSRRDVPRKRVPAGSVAIAIGQTTIYPMATPGGWHILGTALPTIYDPHRDQPFLFAPGDLVRFEPTTRPALPSLPEPLELLPEHPRRPALRVEEPGLLDLVLDRGRPMASRFGMAQSGPMDATAARVANAVVGNQGGAPLIELTLAGPTLIAVTDLIAACVGDGLTMLVDGLPRPSGKGMPIRAGERITFQANDFGARAYFAIAGGIEASSFLGSVSADLFGLVGRPLRAGDVLGLASRSDAPPFLTMAIPAPRRHTEIRLLPGPQAAADSIEALTAAPFAVTALDRMGVRLDGAEVPASHDIISEATPLGAVQITTAGDPVILLNDRGRIGGYPKPAVVDPRDLPLLGQLLPGAAISFAAPSTVSSTHWFIDA